MTVEASNDERLVHGLVNYTVEVAGQVVIVENVPARIDVETGERFFAPEIVEQLQAIVWQEREPDGFARTPVYRFAA